MVVNCRLHQRVTLHDVLHGFRAGRGIGTATLEEKLAHQLEGIAHEPLFQVFLDVREVYDSLDRARCMEILRGYGMGQNTVHLIACHWDSLIFSPKARRFLGMVFGTGRGVTQGNPGTP